MRKVTFVTGGSSGIGAEIARQAAEDGHHVVVFARRSGPVGRHVPVDLATHDGWDTLAGVVESEMASADAVEMFHCAGTLTPIGFAGEVDAAAYRTNVLLNAAAPQVIGDLFLRLVAARQVPATLVMITSGAARHPYPGWSAYSAGKAAMDSWVTAVGAEQSERDGVKVVAIAPGVVDTPMQGEIRQTDASDFPSVERFRALHADGELGDPVDVARRIRAAVDALSNGAVVDLRDL
ncbi:MAG: SDR family NAD(P)-dependent oxidoreductase [Acidimicrobiia bacterium]